MKKNYSKNILDPYVRNKRTKKTSPKKEVCIIEVGECQIN